MNANELADLLEVDSWYKLVTREEIATMLRQFGLAESIVKQQALDIEEWKRKYKDMHNLATQAMSRVHQLEKAKANELADLLEVDSWYKLVTREEIATMLRQQQAEIEALKAELRLIDELVTGKAQEK